jgi:hypothetical protein
MAFDLSEYEPVENRIRAFWLKYPNGRILTDLKRTERSDGRIEWIGRSEAYTNSEDIRPQSTGFATEIEGTTPVNRANASENCETSSIGRALANLGFATKGKRPSREEMEKVENLQGQAVDYYQPKNVKSASESINDLKQVLGAKLMSEPPKCEHGHRLKRMGTSDKTGKPYLGWACTEKARAKQCPIIWWKQTPDGLDWLSPEDYSDYLNERGLSLDPKSEREPVPEHMKSESERANAD